MTEKYNVEVFNKFKEILPHSYKQPTIGVSPYKWVEWICENSDQKFLKESLNQMRKEHICREDIYEMVKDKEVKIEICIYSILAWGGMRRGNGLAAIKEKDVWMPICKKIREGKLCRERSYEKFKSIRSEGKIKGMGPAFFTKLIFFLMHGQSQNDQGYIMDQWTASSVNLMSNNDNLVQLRKENNSYFVSDKNTQENYQNFCKYIEMIAKECKKDPVDIEVAMFSKGGKKKAKWRQVVVDSRGSKKASI